MNNKLVYLQGFLYTIIGMLTPVGAVLVTDTLINDRVIAVMVVSAVVAGANSLKSFLSTTFADSPASKP